MNEAGAARGRHVVIAGSGIAGTMAAHALLESGQRVTMVERGAGLSTAQSAAIIAQGSFQKAGMPFLRRVRRIRSDGRGYDRALPAVAGGLAEFYQAVSLRFRAEDFADWPIGADEMEGPFAEAERLMGVAVPDTPFPPITQRFATAAEQLGMRAERHPLAIQGRLCRQCRNCNQVPCVFGARFSPASFAAQVLSGRAGFTVRQAEVERVRELADEVEIALAGGEIERADAVLLCAGAIDSAIVLIRSGLGGPMAGRNLMLHGLATVQGLFGPAVSRGRGFEKYFSVFDHYLDEAGVRGIIQQDQLPAIEHLRDRLPGPLYRLVDRAYDHLAKLLVMVADEARPENRVELRPDGMAQVCHGFSPRDSERLGFLAARAGEILRAAGALHVHTVENKSIFHACGTARMGTDPATSVTARDGRVHGTRRIFVGDAATFCSSGGVNPSLTIAANALRIARGLVP